MTCDLTDFLKGLNWGPASASAPFRILKVSQRAAYVLGSPWDSTHGLPHSRPDRGTRRGPADRRWEAPSSGRSSACCWCTPTRSSPTTGSIDELWPGERREQAAKTLQVTVSRLRTALEPGRSRWSHRGSARHARTRLPAPRRSRACSTSSASRRWLKKGAGRSPPGDAPSARATLDQALACGAARRLPTWPTSRSASPRSRGSRSCARPRSRIASRPTSQLGRHAELVGELRGLVERGAAARAPARTADARAVSVRAPGRGARGLPGRAERAVEELGIEPGARAARARAGDPEAGPALDPAGGGDRRRGRRRAPGRRLRRPRAELAELLRGLEDALAGRGRLFLLVGEPGIGKSRLSKS